MERVRPPLSAEASSLDTVGPLPASPSLKVLLDVVRSPGVLSSDVDALVRELARPLAEGESPRQRADFLLALLESRDVGELQGQDKLTVHAASVKALLGLGYPYALELSPEALASSRGEAYEAGPLKLPVPGLMATLAGLIIQCFQALPDTLHLMLDSEEPERAAVGLLTTSMLLAPAAAAVAGGLLRKPGLRGFGLITMIVTGSIWSLAFTLSTPLKAYAWSQPFTYVALVAALGFLGGAFLMRPSEWRPEEEELPTAVEAPPEPPIAPA